MAKSIDTFRRLAFCLSDCKTIDCSRHFGHDDQAEAEKTWGDQTFPIHFRDFSPDCAMYESGERDMPKALARALCHVPAGAIRQSTEQVK